MVTSNDPRNIYSATFILLEVDLLKMDDARIKMFASRIKMAATRIKMAASALTLLRATMKGVLRSLSRLIDSMVWGSRPCMMSTTRMAISQRDEPRLRRLLEQEEEQSKYKG